MLRIGEPDDPAHPVRGPQLMGDIELLQAQDPGAPAGQMMDGGAPHPTDADDDDVIHRHFAPPSALGRSPLRSYPTFTTRSEGMSPSCSLAGGLQEAPDKLAVVPDPGVYRLRDERLQLRDQALGLRAAQEAQRPGDSEARSEGAAAPLPFVDRYSADVEVKGKLDDRGFSQVEAGQQGG